MLVYKRPDWWPLACSHGIQWDNENIYSWLKHMIKLLKEDPDSVVVKMTTKKVFRHAFLYICFGFMSGNSEVELKSPTYKLLF